MVLRRVREPRSRRTPLRADKRLTGVARRGKDMTKVPQFRPLQSRPEPTDISAIVDSDVPARGRKTRISDRADCGMSGRL